MLRPHPRPVLLAVLLVASLSLPAFAAGDVCDFGAYADDPDPAGANVRSGPGTGFPVIGVLKSYDDDGYAFGPQFRVTGFETGWFKIGDAAIGQYGDGPDQTVFTGPGWISAELVSFEIEDPNLREAPSLEAATTLKFEGAWYVDMVGNDTVHGCQGGFLNVTVTNESGASATGWATDLCGNQATTCS